MPCDPGWTNTGLKEAPDRVHAITKLDRPTGRAEIVLTVFEVVFHCRISWTGVRRVPRAETGVARFAQEHQPTQLAIHKSTERASLWPLSPHFQELRSAGSKHALQFSDGGHNRQAASRSA